MSKNNNNIKDTHDIKDYALDIGTVDSFQGSDRDIIIYDCVRCSKSKNNNNVKGRLILLSIPFLSFLFIRILRFFIAMCSGIAFFVLFTLRIKSIEIFCEHLIIHA